MSGRLIDRPRAKSAALPVLFCLAVACLLLPLWAYQYFPSADGPTHVLNASLLSRLIFANDSGVQDWYKLNAVLVPNLSGHLLLMGLLHFLAAPAAERVLIGVCVVAFVFAFRYFLRAFSTGTQGLEFLGLPIAYNLHVYWASTTSVSVSRSI